MARAYPKPAKASKRPARPTGTGTRSMPARSNKGGAVRGQARATQVKAMNAARRAPASAPVSGRSPGILRIEKFVGATAPSGGASIPAPGYGTLPEGGSRAPLSKPRLTTRSYASGINRR